MIEPTLWQRFDPEELDRHVKMMIRFRLIQRRRIYILVQGRRLLYVRGSVEPSWEYRVTPPGQLLLKLLLFLTRYKVLPE